MSSAGKPFNEHRKHWFISSALQSFFYRSVGVCLSIESQSSTSRMSYAVCHVTGSVQSDDDSVNFLDLFLTKTHEACHNLITLLSVVQMTIAK